MACSLLNIVLSMGSLGGKCLEWGDKLVLFLFILFAVQINNRLKMSCWLAITSQQHYLFCHTRDQGPGVLRKEDTNSAMEMEKGEASGLKKRGASLKVSLKKWTRSWWHGFPQQIRGRWLKSRYGENSKWIGGLDLKVYKCWWCFWN